MGMPATTALRSERRCGLSSPWGQGSRHLPDDGEGAVQRWMERAKAHVRAKVEHHPFRVLQQQFGFWKTRRRALVKNHGKVMVLGSL